MTLGDIFSFRSTNSLSRENLNYSEGLVKNIHYGDIHTKFHLLFDIKKEIVPFINLDVDLSRIPIDNYCKNGDLIIADASEDYADIGKSIEIINLNNEKVLAGLHTILARPDKYKMHLGFSGYLLKSTNVRLQIMRFAQGTKVLGISAKRLAEINVEIPSMDEQVRIVDFLIAIDDKINFSNSNIEAIEKYKNQLIEN
jgi:type I restriction enzyme S subunit